MSRKELMPKFSPDINLRRLLKYVGVGVLAATVAEEAHAKDTKGNLEAASTSDRANSHAQTAEYQGEGFQEQLNRMGLRMDSPKTIGARLLQPPAEIGDPVVSSTDEKPPLVTAMPVESVEQLVEQEDPIVVGQVEIQSQFPNITIMDGTNLRTEPVIGENVDRVARAGESYVSLPEDRGGQREGIDGYIWFAVLPNPPAPSQRPLYVRQDRVSDYASSSSWVVTVATVEELQQLSQEAGALNLGIEQIVPGSEAGVPVGVRWSEPLNGYEVVATFRQGVWTAEPAPYAYGVNPDTSVVSVGEMNELGLTPDQVTAIVDAARAPYDRLITGMPESAVSLFMEPEGNVNYIWAMDATGTKVGLWNMTPDGGEWVELRIDQPDRSTMVNPEVFDQIPEWVKQGYPYSRDLGGYFRIQTQHDGQNAIEVFMPRLVGFYDESTGRTLDGWGARLFDSFYNEDQGTINVFGVGDFENRRLATVFRGVVEGDDERVEGSLRAGFREAVYLMYETADGEFNPRLSTEEVAQALNLGTAQLQMTMPNDWERWIRESGISVEQLRLSNPRMFSVQTMRPSSGLNIVYVAQVSEGARLQTARWWAPEIYERDFQTLAIARGFSVNEQGRLDIFSFSGNDGSNSINRLNLDGSLAISLAKAVKLSWENPPAREQNGYSAHQPWTFRISGAMGIGSSLREQEQLVARGYDPILDNTPAPSQS